MEQKLVGGQDQELLAGDIATDRTVQAGPELSVIIPTKNERDNVVPLVQRLSEVLRGIAWEAIFVDDDSTDGTIETVIRVAARDRRVRLLHRIGRRGLSTACIEGIQASTAPFFAVMDGDLQHDERLLPAMLATLKAEPLDIVVGSRYIAGGGVDGWDPRRVSISGIATRLGKLILRAPVADPMSGFFMLRRAAFDRCVRRLSAISFKILIDILASAPEPLRLKELPYHFRQRVAGESKMDSFVVWEYLLLLADKLIGHIVPVRFALFSLVGLVGVAAQLSVLWLCLTLPGFPFALSQGIATGTAMVGNFYLNNVLTYSDRRLRGWGFVRGLLSFCAVCGVGAIGNIGIGLYVIGTGQGSWWLAGLAGAATSAVWNYAVSSFVTWKRS